MRPQSYTESMMIENNDGRYYHMPLYRVLELLELAYNMLKQPIGDQEDAESERERTYTALVMIRGFEGS